MINLGPEYLKILFIFLIKTFEFRMDFIESMSINEYYNIFKILDFNYPIYNQCNNQNIQYGYNEEYFEVNKNI
jgi:hypothetical protein